MLSLKLLSARSCLSSTLLRALFLNCVRRVYVSRRDQLMNFQSGNESGREIMLKQSIVHTVQALVTVRCHSISIAFTNSPASLSNLQALGDQSAPLASIIVPIVQQCLSPEFIVQMDEDGMKLWLAALRATNTLQGVNGQTGLVDLFPLAIHTLRTNKDLLGKMSDIMESYFLLGATQLAQVCPVRSLVLVLQC